MGVGVIPEGPHLWAPILAPEVASKDKRKPGEPSFFSVPCFSDVRAGVDLEEGWERGGTWVRAWQEMSWAKPWLRGERQPNNPPGFPSLL